MSGLFKQYKTNSAKESEGVEIEFAEAQNEDGTIPTFIISRMGKGNKAYSKSLEAATRPYRRQVELGTLKNEVAEGLFLGVFVDTILRGWKNVQAEDGSELPYTKDNATKLLTDLPDVYERLQEEAKLSANFRDSSLETEAGN
ncbi:tail protein [Burkholderia phage vB_BceS_KL1]|nr:tail assembly chaperone [Burkholderia phage vB_BceS_KL1]AEX56102.1 tail protein [Burkholderia phage vB_BceS_KL1]